MCVGAGLRRSRLRLDRTQASVADEIGITVEAYSRVERGRSLPSYPTLIQACAALQITPDQLLLPAADRDGASCESNETPGPARGERPDAASTPAPRSRSPRRPAPYPRVKNPAPEDPDERDAATLTWLSDVLARLPKDDLVVVHTLIHHLAVKAQVLPPIGAGVEAGPSSRLRRAPQKGGKIRRIRGKASYTRTQTKGGVTVFSRSETEPAPSPKRSCDAPPPADTESEA